MKVALERINQDYLFKVVNSNGHIVLFDNKLKKRGGSSGHKSNGTCWLKLY
jgi:hypothetical protein